MVIFRKIVARGQGGWGQGGIPFCLSVLFCIKIYLVWTWTSVEAWTAYCLRVLGRNKQRRNPAGLRSPPLEWVRLVVASLGRPCLVEVGGGAPVAATLARDPEPPPADASHVPVPPSSARAPSPTSRRQSDLPWGATDTGRLWPL